MTVWFFQNIEKWGTDAITSKNTKTEKLTKYKWYPRENMT